MDWILDASIEICNTLVRLEANGRDLSATECKNIIAKHYAAQQCGNMSILSVEEVKEILKEEVVVIGETIYIVHAAEEICRIANVTADKQ